MQSEQILPSQVTAATIYPGMGRITRTATTQLEPGPQTVAIDHLPARLDPDAVRLSGSGTAHLTILDFQVQPFHFPVIPSEQVQVLQERMDELKAEQQELQDEHGIRQRQLDFLLQIGAQSSAGISQELERGRVTPEEWKSTLSFLGDEGSDLHRQQRELTAQLKKVEEEIKDIQSHLNRYAGASTKMRHRLLVNVDVKKAGQIAFAVSYSSYEVSWQPLYDARVDTRERTVRLSYFGGIVQRTGEDWEQVAITLSTARPMTGGNPPHLYPWILREHRPMPAAMTMMRSSAPKMRKKSAAVAEDEMSPEDSFGGMAEEAEVATTTIQQQDGANVTFSPDTKSDIPGDGSRHKLLVMEHTFPNEFRYLTVPKHSPHVFLTAEVSNDTQYPLLSGPLNIYTNDNLSGRASIPQLVAPGEKFELSLGIDEAIKVEHRLRQKTGDEKGLFSKQRHLRYAYEILLDNQYDRRNTVIVRDQIPVSEEDKIKVQLDKIIPAEHEGKNDDELPMGALEWKIALEPREKQKIEFAFDVRYAPNIEVEGL